VKLPQIVAAFVLALLHIFGNHPSWLLRSGLSSCLGYFLWTTLLVVSRNFQSWFVGAIEGHLMLAQLLMIVVPLLQK
jgi:hypothetical protein